MCQDWKAGDHKLGNVPSFAPDLPAEAGDDIAEPEMNLAVVQDGKLSLPESIRGKWLDDPIRKQEWATEVAAFDARLLN